MDDSGIVAATTETTQSGTADPIQLAILKKAMDIQAKGGMRKILAYFRAYHFVPVNYLSVPRQRPM